MDSVSGSAILDKIQLVWDSFLMAVKVHYQSPWLHRAGTKVKHDTRAFPKSLPPDTACVLLQLHTLSCQCTRVLSLCFQITSSVEAESRSALLNHQVHAACCYVFSLRTQNTKVSFQFQSLELQRLSKHCCLSEL